MSQEPTPFNFPDWVLNAPADFMAMPKQTPVSIGEQGKFVSAHLLMEALGVEVGVGVGAFSMEPEMAQRIAELTENPNWKNLAPEPTIVTRKQEDQWEISVGEYSGVFAKEGIIVALTKALQQSVEGDNA